MSTDIDWQHELDSSFGSGHDVATGHYVVAGRRAVRRRRITAVVVAATVAICGGAAWAASPGSAPRSDAPVATHGPSPTAATEKPDRKQDRDRDRRRDVLGSMSVEEEFLGNPAVLEDGELKLSPLAGEVLERVPNPMGYTPEQGHSIAIRAMYEGREKYSLIASFSGGSWSANTHDATGDFAGWVATNVRTQQTLDVANGVTPPAGGTSAVDRPDDWLTLGPDGEVASASPFVAVMEARAVELGAGFAPEDDRTGVARLRVGGTQQLVAWRVVAGELEVVPGPGRFASLDAFIDWARSQYASGEGMR